MSLSAIWSSLEVKMINPCNADDRLIGAETVYSFHLLLG
jgi:hypothetical protein